MVVTFVQTGSNPLMSIYAFSQIVLGIEKAARYSRVKTTLGTKPSEEVFESLESLLADVASDPAGVEFTVAGYPKIFEWKGQLRPEAGVFVSADHEVVFAHRDDIEVTRVHKQFFGDLRKARIRVADRLFQAKLKREDLERLTRWLHFTGENSKPIGRGRRPI